MLTTNPITIKTAMQICGRDTGDLRLPLCEMEPANADTLRALLAEAGIERGVGAARPV